MRTAEGDVIDEEPDGRFRAVGDLEDAARKSQLFDKHLVVTPSSELKWFSANRSLEQRESTTPFSDIGWRLDLWGQAGDRKREARLEVTGKARLQLKVQLDSKQA